MATKGLFQILGKRVFQRVQKKAVVHQLVVLEKLALVRQGTLVAMARGILVVVLRKIHQVAWVETVLDLNNRKVCWGQSNHLHQLVVAPLEILVVLLAGSLPVHQISNNHKYFRLHCRGKALSCNRIGSTKRTPNTPGGISFHSGTKSRRFYY